MKQTILYKQIKELKPYKKNAKKHPKEQVERIANSIKEFGFTQPVLVDKHMNVVAGHGRVLGAKKAGIDTIPTLCLENLSKAQINAYRLADNKLNESDWDMALLNEELKELLDDGVDMELFGFETEPLLDDDVEVEADVPFTEILHEENNYIVLKFNNKVDWVNALGVLGIQKVKAYPTKKEGNNKSFGDRCGVGRVIDGTSVIERLGEHEV